jgi:Ca2+-binding EF-hand superfamily protein
MKAHRLLLPLACLALAACQTATPNRFDEADLNSDAKLSRDEVTDYMVTSIFVTRDTNKDKSMSTAEWNPEKDAAAAKIFTERDTNQDGAVTLDEAKAYAKKVGSYNALVKEADTDKDGAINREEASAYYASKEGPVR